MCEDVLLRLLVILIHREVVNIAETESVLLDEVESCAELVSDLTSTLISLSLCVCDKEDCIALLKSCKCSKLRLHIIRNELIDRSLVRHILENLKVAQTAHTELVLSELEHLLVLALGKLGMNIDSSYCLTDERLECAA